MGQTSRSGTYDIFTPFPPPVITDLRKSLITCVCVPPRVSLFPSHPPSRPAKRRVILHRRPPFDNPPSYYKLLMAHAYVEAGGGGGRKTGGVHFTKHTHTHSIRACVCSPFSRLFPLPPPKTRIVPGCD